MDRETPYLKPIALDQLRPGMFIHGLPCRWFDHPFMRSRFLVPDDETVAAVRRVPVRFVWIDTRRGIDVPTPDNPPEPISELRPRSGGALETWRDAVGHVTSIMSDLRLGRDPERAEVEATVGDLMEMVVDQPMALYGLARVRSKDRYTFEHCVSVGLFAMGFCNALGLPREETLQIGVGALLHDIGKVYTPEAILNKPGRLTPAEMAVMRRHVEHSGEILERVGVSPLAYAVAARHHERLDGSGYPARLAAGALDQSVRLVAICDVYDAMTSARVYRPGLPPTEALRQLLSGAGTAFDDELVHRFIRFVGIYPPGTLVRLSDDRLAVVVGHGEDLLRPRLRPLVARNPSCRLADELVLWSGSSLRIAASEDPLRWGIDPAHLLLLATQNVR